MHKALALGALAITLAAVVGIAQSGLPWFEGPDGQKPVNAGQPQKPTGSLMLTVQIDASGVTVLQATAKPDVAFRLPKDWETMPLRWILRDSQGKALAEGGFDPAQLCLDPAHKGQPPHVQGDQLIPHVGHVNLKVPNLQADGRLAFSAIEFSMRKDDTYQPFGIARSDAMSIR